MKIKHYLKLSNITLREFAKKADMDIGYISQISNGKISPGFKTIKKIIDASEGNITVEGIYQGYLDAIGETKDEDLDLVSMYKEYTQLKRKNA